MNWDVIVFLALVIVVVVMFRKFSSVVYFVAIFDILLRLLTFLRLHIGLPDVAALIEKYIPASLPAMIDSYTSGWLSEVLLWVYAGLFVVFEFYVIKTFWHKKK